MAAAFLCDEGYDFLPSYFYFPVQCWEAGDTGGLGFGYHGVRRASRAGELVSRGHLSFLIGTGPGVEHAFSCRVERAIFVFCFSFWAGYSIKLTTT